MLVRRRRARRRRRLGVVDAAWLVGLLFPTILLVRLVQIWDAIQHDGCESVLFWLDGWHEGRSLLQVMGAMLAALTGLWGAWLLGRGAVVPKLAAGVLLLVLLAAFDRQARLYLPDRPHPLASVSDRFVSSPDAFWEHRSWTHPRHVVLRADDPGLEAAMRRDPLAGWAADDGRGSGSDAAVVGADGRTVTRYRRLTRRPWLVGPDAPTHAQLAATRACVRYNEGLPARRAAQLAREPGARAGDGYDWDEEGTLVTVLPPLVPFED